MSMRRDSSTEGNNERVRRNGRQKERTHSESVNTMRQRNIKERKVEATRRKAQADVPKELESTPLQVKLSLYIKHCRCDVASTVQ